MTVEAGKTYRVRMINAGSLAFLSVCFAGHNVTVMAADAYPINPLQAACVDINLGQRCASLYVSVPFHVCPPSPGCNTTTIAVSANVIKAACTVAR